MKLIALITGLAMAVTAAGQYPYQDAALPVEERVADLMGRMSMDEKLDQLCAQVKFPGRHFERNYKVGHFFFRQKVFQDFYPFDLCAEAINEDTKKSIEANRWGIPVLQHGEALHGAQFGYGTSFPQSIAMAATFDEELYFEVGQAVASELRAVGVRQVYAPVVNISRDPRWGRTQEGYGEDVLLNSRMGMLYTKALEQGGVISSPKHYVDNYGSGGRESWASTTSWRELREVYLEPFRACVEEGGARSIMAAYNSVDGVPCTESSVLLNDILREEWGFNGFTVSDWGGIKGVFAKHLTAENYSEAFVKSLTAGLDVELPVYYAGRYTDFKKGLIPEEVINQAVERVLRCKFELGLFENPYVDPAKANDEVQSEQHRQLALRAARKCMTLLKNEEQALPLDKGKIKKIGLFGPGRNDYNLGSYEGPWGKRKKYNVVTPAEAFEDYLKGEVEVLVHQDGQDVKELAKRCDAVVFFGAIVDGENADRSRLKLPVSSKKYGNVHQPHGDDAAIILSESHGFRWDYDQEEIIHILSECGAKTIVVLQTGGPVDVQNWLEEVDALLEGWYAGQNGNTAIAEAIFGEINPAGRTPISWPRHDGQIPVYYSLKPSGRSYAYLDDNALPVFPFGYGLSYTTFEYSNLKLPADIQWNEPVEIKLTVKNTGTVRGDEVVQLYLRDVLASVVRPFKELKAYQRITLKPGESKEIILTVPWRSFGLWNRSMEYVIEPGEFKVFVGPDSGTTTLEGTLEIK